MTFGLIKARIADEMKRGDLTACATAVAQAVVSAISFYSRRRFYFNEFVDTTYTHSASQTYVSLSSDVIQIDSMKAVISSRDYPLSLMGWKEMDSVDSGQFFGYPDFYAIKANRVRLYPPPNQDYVIRTSGVKELPEVSLNATANATNAWVDTSDAEGIIRNKAKAYLFRDHLRNHQQAQVFDAQAEREASELSRETKAKASTGRIRQSYW